MRILVSNDDGIFSPGILELARIASRFGEVRIVAPDVEQSSSSHAITSTRPLSYRETRIEGFEAYRVNGTPADCVALGTHNWERIDAVLSGINLGLNLGNAMWHSGTLAAAKQASLLGIQGIALSAPVSKTEPRLDGLREAAHEILERVLGDRELPLVNVNLPHHPRGIRWTRQAVTHYDGEIVPGEDPMGRSHFWFVVRRIADLEEGTDLWAVREGYASVTPLRLDLTDHRSLAGARDRHPFPNRPPGDPQAAAQEPRELPEEVMR